MSESTKPYLYFERIMNGIVSIPESVQQKLSNVMLVRRDELLKQQEQERLMQQEQEQLMQQEEPEQKSIFSSWMKSEPQPQPEPEPESSYIIPSWFKSEPKPESHDTRIQFEKKCDIRGWSSI